MNDMGHEVAVTGMGAITPIGADVEAFWSGLVAGRSGVGPITLFNASELPVRIAAEVKAQDWDARRSVPDLVEEPRASRGALFAVAAARAALAQAGIAEVSRSSTRVGVFLGVSSGRGVEPCIAAAEDAPPDWLRFGPRALALTDPHRLWWISSRAMTAWLARACGARGPTMTIMTACTAGAQAIGIAIHALRRGEIDVAVAGGVSTMVDPLAVAGFARLQALSVRNEAPAAASRPFDGRRDGFVIGEGAGIVVLERLVHARARRATRLALLTGYSSTADAYRITDSDPDGRGAARAMIAALRDAGRSPAEVGYVNAHGTSTHVNDRAETIAIKAVLDRAARRVPISSNKSMIGHLIAAAGAVEVIATVLTVTRGVVPPTINHEDPDPECNLDYVPNRARAADIRVAISNSFGFGGLNACLVVERSH